MFIAVLITQKWKLSKCPSTVNKHTVVQPSDRTLLINKKELSIDTQKRNDESQNFYVE